MLGFDSGLTFFTHFIIIIYFLFIIYIYIYMAGFGAAAEAGVKAEVEVGERLIEKKLNMRLKEKLKM